MKRTMTLTEGLSKLKLYDKKIEKVLREIVNGNSIIDYKKANSQVTEKYRRTVEELEKDSKAIMDKYKALTKNRDALKAAIAQANATAMVTIAGKKYTIVEAIERKRTIENDKTLLNYLKNRLNDVQSKVNYINEKAQEQANAIIETKVGAEAKNSKPEDIKALYDLIYEKNKVEIVDPLNLEKLIQDLEELIDAFEQEVDINLSIVNARTEIEVDFEEE